MNCKRKNEENINTIPPDLKILVESESCPVNLEQEFTERDGYEVYYEKLRNGRMSGEDIRELIWELIASCDCGATMRFEITKIPIDPNSLTRKNTYERLGWTDPDAFSSHDFSEEEKPDWNYKEYGYALYKWGQYYILMSGIST